MPKRKEKILVAMSGGVDSSVAAALLVRAGYDVTGAFMVNYDAPLSTSGMMESCWLPDYRDALRVAAHIGIPLLKLDFTAEYRKRVLAYLFREYRKGRTPNPDVLCNTFIKFGVWLDEAKRRGFDMLATGHYAQIQPSAIGCQLLAAKDHNKDQTYFLHQLNQEQLSRVLFPIGDLRKSEVRTLARRFTLPTADKAESMGICFVGEVPMKDFLARHVAPKKGKVVTTAGEAVGEHDGLPLYTIGQRHGFAQAGGKEPLYVVGKDMRANTLIVGGEDDPRLYARHIVLDKMHWVSGQAPQFPIHCEVRFRHRQPLSACRVVNKGKRIVVECRTPQRAVTPGQFAVLYAAGECLGGGTIRETISV
jgi:tRNA-specific 2-thiouridylase